MTTAAYQQIISAPPRDRLDLFLATANRLGTSIGNVEKDFWVCWTLNALYHERPAAGPRQTLLLWYPEVEPRDGAYVRPAVRLESGAKSALDPHQPVPITPYINNEAPELKLAVTGVTTIEAGRTFWDKVVIAQARREASNERERVNGKYEQRPAEEADAEDAEDKSDYEHGG